MKWWEARSDQKVQDEEGGSVQWALELRCVRVESSSGGRFAHLEVIPGRVGQ